MQFAIQAYMKHLGVKVKESRGFEPKPKLINLLPKIKVRPPTPPTPLNIYYSFLKQLIVFIFPSIYCFHLEQKTIKPEKDGGVEVLKKSRFQIMRSHNKRPSRTDVSSSKPFQNEYSMYGTVCVY